LYEEDTLDPCFYIEESKNEKVGFKENLDMMEMSNTEGTIKALEPMQKIINDIDLNIDQEIPPSFYYYKRWLWMTFPWACL
jgi:aminopeptidase-like protein